MGEYIKKDRKGTFWKEQNSNVVWKGSIHHKANENDKGVDKYYTILKTAMKDKFGNPNNKFELVQSVGLLYLKDGNANENAPDIGGPVTIEINGEVVSQKFGGWLNTNEETQTTTLSVGLIDAIKKEDSNVSFSSNSETLTEDDMPF